MQLNDSARFPGRTLFAPTAHIRSDVGGGVAGSRSDQCPSGALNRTSGPALLAGGHRFGRQAPTPRQLRVPCGRIWNPPLRQQKDLAPEGSKRVAIEDGSPSRGAPPLGGEGWPQGHEPPPNHPSVTFGDSFPQGKPLVTVGASIARPQESHVTAKLPGRIWNPPLRTKKLTEVAL